jgi:hypothetical protein
MSRHHRAQRWTTFARQRRIELAAQLPLPCIRCGRPVMPDPAGRQRTTWHVGHRDGAAQGGQPTRANTGAEHARCNLSAGGKLGAAITHRRVQAGDPAAGRGIRQW